MRRRSTWVLVAAAGVLVAVLAWPRRPAGPRAPTQASTEEAADRAAAPPAGLAPRPAPAVELPPVARGLEGATAGASEPKRSVRGVVRDADGAPVPQAEVYARRKDAAPSAEPPRTRVRTGDDGRWALDLASPRGHWIGARAPGRLHGFADGDAVALDADVTLVLEPGGRVEVRVLDAEGLPRAGVSVTADPEDPGGAVRYPAPDEAAEGPGSDAKTGPDGRATLLVGTRGPVVVKPRSWSDVTDPPRVRLPTPEGRVEFRLLPSCRLRVIVVDGTTGRPFERPFLIRITRPEEPDAWWGAATTNPERTGVFRVEEGLAVRAYDVSVQSDGWRATERGRVTFERAGAELDFPVTLVPERGLATIVLTWPDSPARRGDPWYSAPSPGSTSAFRHTVMLRRTAPERGAWGGSVAPGEVTFSLPLGRERYDEATRQTTIDLLPPGAFDVLAWEHGTWTVAFAHDVRVGPDGITKVRLDLVPGTRVRADDLALPAVSRKGLALEAPPLGDLPLVHFPSVSTMSTYGSGNTIPAGVVFGPFPFDSVTASFPGPDGQRVQRVLRDVR